MNDSQQPEININVTTTDSNSDDIKKMSLPRPSVSVTKGNVITNETSKSNKKDKTAKYKTKKSKKSTTATEVDKTDEPVTTTEADEILEFADGNDISQIF